MALLFGSLTHAAVIDLLDAEPGITVHATGAPDLSVPPYVTAWISVDRSDTDRLEGATNRVWWRITTHAVGATADAALRVAGHVRNALLDRRPVIAGGQTTRIHHDNGRPPVSDESTGETVVAITDQWTFQTWPARP